MIILWVLVTIIVVIILSKTGQEAATPPGHPDNSPERLKQSGADTVSALLYLRDNYYATPSRFNFAKGDTLLVLKTDTCLTGYKILMIKKLNKSPYIMRNIYISHSYRH